MFRLTSYHTIDCIEKKRDTYSVEEICVPPRNNTDDLKAEDKGYFRRKNANYSLLDEHGIVRPRQEIHTKNRSGETVIERPATVVKKGDVIIGKVIVTGSKTGEETKVDASVVIQPGEEGIIDRVHVMITPNGYKLVKVVIRVTREPTLGDKLASRSAQKGTIGMVYRQEDMPFTAQGITPDIIINPCCLAGDTEITLDNLQARPISKIVEDQKKYTVQTVSPSTFTQVGSEICNSFAIKPTHKMLKISTISGRTIMCTADHKFLTDVNTWVEAQNLTPLDSLTVLHSTRTLSSHESKIDGSLSHEKLQILARLIGALDSHGCVGRRHLGKIRYFTKSAKDTVAMCKDITNVLGTANCTMVIQIKPDHGIFNVVVPRDNSLELLFIEYGYDEYCFTVPEFVKNGSLEIKRQFLCGMKECDIINFFKIQVKSIFEPDESEKRYLADLTKLFRDLDISCEIKEEGYNISLYIEKEYENLERYYELIESPYSVNDRINSRNTIEYIKMVNRGVIDVTQEKVRNMKAGMCIRVPVLSVEEIEVPEFVYDFQTVSENHSFVANSIVVHNCIPSRMTVGQLIECALGKDCALTGRYGDATPFTTNSADVADKLVKEIHERMEKTGFSSHGWEKMYDALTGEEIEARIFIGPTYYQRLKHMVDDKMHARARGHVTTLTRQPLEGRSRDGQYKTSRKVCLILCVIHIKIKTC
jgi:intein/homing endonuclease